MAHVGVFIFGESAQSSAVPQFADGRLTKLRLRQQESTFSAAGSVRFSFPWLTQTHLRSSKPAPARMDVLTQIKKFSQNRRIEHALHSDERTSHRRAVDDAVIVYQPYI